MGLPSISLQQTALPLEGNCMYQSQPMTAMSSEHLKHDLLNKPGSKPSVYRNRPFSTLKRTRRYSNSIPNVSVGPHVFIVCKRTSESNLRISSDFSNKRRASSNWLVSCAIEAQYQCTGSMLCGDHRRKFRRIAVFHIGKSRTSRADSDSLWVT